MRAVQQPFQNGSAHMKILDIKKYGPIYRFSDANLYWTLYHLSKSEFVGRRNLAFKVGIGEGSMRNILKILKEWNFVTVENRGIIISDEGRLFLQSIPIEVIRANLSEYVDVQDQYCCGIIVFKQSSKIQDGLKQRDICIRSGANGCITFIMKNGRLTIPPGHSLDTEYSGNLGGLENSLNLAEGDVLILSYSADEYAAANAAVIASLDLI